METTSPFEMSNWAIILNSIIVLLLLYIYYQFKYRLPSYYQEKGKNLATKQDIGEITKIVESIRAELNRDTEILKSQLSLKVQKTFGLQTLERDAIIDLNRKVLAVVSFLMRFNPETITNLKSPNYTEFQNKLFHLNNEMDLASGTFILFNRDESFANSRMAMANTLIELSTLVQQQAVSVAKSYFEYESQKAITPNDQEKFEDNLYQAITSLRENTNSEKITLYNKFKDEHSDFLDLIINRLKDILNEEN